MQHTLIALGLNIFQKFIGNKNINKKIYRIQARDSTMCGYFCIGFIDFMVKCKSGLDYSNLFSPSQYEKKIKIKLKCFQELKRKNVFSKYMLKGSDKYGSRKH